MKYYAGIGSRETPPDVLKQMTELATVLQSKGYTLRSGGADGADNAFLKGATLNAYKTPLFCSVEIFIPWNGFNSFEHWNAGTAKSICNLQQKHYDLASTLHPAWDRCSQGARKLHARNTQQILGENLDNPVDFVICWTPNGEMIGGTATAMKLAKQNKIPVFNLALEENVTKLNNYIHSWNILEALEE